MQTGNGMAQELYLHPPEELEALEYGVRQSF